MQVVVRTPRIEINVKGAVIPPKLLTVLEEEYGDGMKIFEDDGDDLIAATDTDWFKNIKKDMTPGEYLRIYRENKGMTQAELGETLGDVRRQYISNMENGCRPISLKMAKKIAIVLDISIEKLVG